MTRTLVQPANCPLAWNYSIPQWRCSRGHWNDVSRIVRRCYSCCDEPKPCEACGGDGQFDDHYGSSQCDTCKGWGVQWDWPNDEPASPQSTPSPDEPVF